MSNNFETDENFIEARYLSETNQYDLEMLVAAPEIVDFGSGTNNLSANSTIIEATAGPNRTGVGCPRLDQYTIVWNFKNKIPEYKLIGSVTTEDFIYFPRTVSIHKIIAAEIVKNKRCCYLKSQNNAEIIASLTQPMIRTAKDEKGLPIQNLAKTSKLMTLKRLISEQSALKERAYAGVFDCMKISLETGFKYPCGSNPDLMFELHNVKPFGELE